MAQMMPAIGESTYIAIVCEGARGKGDNTDDKGGLSHGLCLDFENQFHLPQAKIGEKIAKRSQVGVLVKGLCKRKEPRDSGGHGSYGNGTSMVLGEGKKPSGKEVRVSLQLLLY
jgi:hypothetical protein